MARRLERPTTGVVRRAMWNRGDRTRCHVLVEVKGQGGNWLECVSRDEAAALTVNAGYVAKELLEDGEGVAVWPLGAVFGRVSSRDNEGRRVISLHFLTEGESVWREKAGCWGTPTVVFEAHLCERCEARTRDREASDL